MHSNDTEHLEIALGTLQGVTAVPVTAVAPPTSVGDPDDVRAVLNEEDEHGWPATPEADFPSQQPTCDDANLEADDDTAAKTYSEPEFIALIKANIDKFKAAAAKDKRAFLVKQVTIGWLLTRLKRKTDHGKWAETVAAVGYNKQIAQRLIRLYKSPLVGQMHTGGTHLTDRLPIDTQKLAALATLPADKLAVALDSGIDFDAISRAQLRTAAKHLKDCGQWQLPVAEDASEQTAGNANKPVRADAMSTAAKSPEDGNNKPANAAEVSATEKDDDDEAKPEPAADEAAYRKRLVRFTRLMDEHSRHQGDKAIRAQTEQGFSEFSRDVLAVARKHGRRLCNAACKAVGGDGELLALTLIGHLQKENLENLFGAESLRDETATDFLSCSRINTGKKKRRKCGQVRLFVPSQKSSGVICGQNLSNAGIPPE